jgi:cytochrome c oxidase subunit IV
MEGVANTEAKQLGTHGEHHTPSPRMYVTIGLILFGITLLELAASFIVSAFGAEFEWLQITTLLVLATIKGTLVVLFFMHLRFDSRWFTFLFTTGIILAVFGIVSFMVLFAYKSTSYLR